MNFVDFVVEFFRFLQLIKLIRTIPSTGTWASLRNGSM